MTRPTNHKHNTLTTTHDRIQFNYDDIGNATVKTANLLDRLTLSKKIYLSF